MHKPLFLGAVALTAAAAHADVLYSNFGPGDTYSLDRGWTLSYGGPLGGDVYEQAVAFTVSGGDYYFDNAEVAVLLNWGPDIVYMDLHADDNGNVGDILESTTATGVTDPFVWAPPMVATFSGSTVLHDGQTYWLSMRTEQTDALASWAFNVIDDFGLYAWQLNGGGWNPEMGIPGTDSQRAVFRINATAIPAPATLTLLAPLALARRRR
jgi:hypothetical protein